MRERENVHLTNYRKRFWRHKCLRTPRRLKKKIITVRLTNLVITVFSDCEISEISKFEKIDQYINKVFVYH